MKSIRYSDKQVQPSKIVCIGRNYSDHAKELGNAIPKEPVVFLKPNSAITDELISHNNTAHYETELCFLFGKAGIVAASVGLDLTNRTLQNHLKEKGLPWEKAKAFNGSALFSDFIPIAVDDISKLSFSLLINQQRVQHGNVNDMLFSPESLIEYVIRFISFEEGDILMTGTPAGVGAVVAGSFYEAQLFLSDKLLTTAQWKVNR